MIEGAGFKLDTTKAESGKITTDFNSIVQILTNLIENGVKFSNKAERKEIQLIYFEEKDVNGFKVRDFGPGIHESFKGQVLNHSQGLKTSLPVLLRAQAWAFQ